MNHSRLIALHGNLRESFPYYQIKNMPLKIKQTNFLSRPLIMRQILKAWNTVLYARIVKKKIHLSSMKLCP